MIILIYIFRSNSYETFDILLALFSKLNSLFPLVNPIGIYISKSYASDHINHIYSIPQKRAHNSPLVSCRN